MPVADARIRYLTINVVVWIFAACACLGVLAGARRIGMNWTKHQQSVSLIEDARGALQQGKIEVAQDQLETALSLAPTAWPGMARQLGPQLIGLPSVLRSLEHVAAAGDVYGGATALDRARARLLRGDLDSAREVLAEEGGAGDETSYVLGHVLFEQGDLAEAKNAFDRYWGRRTPERERTIAAIVERTAATDEVLWSLVTLGLWDEAIRRGSAADAKATAEGQFLAALKADLAGDRDTARAAYERALAMRPGFLVCLRRLAKL
ncbi:MAG: hypothetical protein HUU46_09570 [Candidatus Hydrogenedentes bacterium]|nr:hypothetical protein [Candidatus Hydrogenedentota bacterium]